MSPNNTVSLKLLIDSKHQRVLFAEAGKDFVDFLLNILLLPVGTVMGVLPKEDMAGIGNLYDSLENLSDTYMQPTANKDTLLNPQVAVSNPAVNLPLLLPNLQTSTSAIGKFYRCNHGSYNCRTYITNDPKSICPNCKFVMNDRVTFVNPPNPASDEGGYVKGVITYMIMDDLVVKPMSTISSITLLNKFNIKDVGVLEEKVIDLGTDEALKLLKMSLQSKTVLTDAFLGKKERRCDLAEEVGAVKYPDFAPLGGGGEE
ncbi:hypothetical protein COLO4_10931 [Corchorus olitorius]|uniref:DUF674 domain-containing protein n=1 Tax=Corchorus olitorius TaxID=93759 RepID=A0A1R3K6E0_9ROSI|nr:hypothetical protein COLO4_10931 [Corchorus olitorius]